MFLGLYRLSRLPVSVGQSAGVMFPVSVPIAPAVVTKSATDSVDSNCFYFRSVLYSLKFSVYSVNYSPSLIKLKQSV